MGFIDDDCFVAAQHGVVLQFVEQDAVGHDFEHGIAARLVCESDLRADGSAVFDLELLCDALSDGQGGDAAWLGAADPPFLAESALDEELGDLGGLFRSPSRLR